MLIRTVHMTFHPERVPDFLALFADARPKIAAQAGCRHLALWQDLRYPNIFTTFSHWDDPAALDAYRHSVLFKTTWAMTKPMFAASPVARSQHDVTPPALSRA
jgi:quinol monooxygenase YgiN